MNTLGSMGPYEVKSSEDKSFGFTGYIVVGPSIVNDGSDMEHGVAKEQCRRLNAAYATGMKAALHDDPAIKAAVEAMEAFNSIATYINEHDGKDGLLVMFNRHGFNSLFSPAYDKLSLALAGLKGEA